MQGVAIRVTPLDGQGNPDPSRAVVSDGFTRVQSATQEETGTTTTVRNAAGGICFSKTSPSEVTGTELTIDFCKVDPELFSLVSSARPVANCDGDVRGMQQGTTRTPGRFALEIWSEVATADIAEAGGSYLYSVFPSVDKGSLGGTLVWEDGAQTYTVVAPGSVNSRWTDGPYGVLQAAGITNDVDAPDAATDWAPAGDAVSLCDWVDPDAFIYQVGTMVKPPMPGDVGTNAGSVTTVEQDNDLSGDPAYAGAAALADLATLKADATEGDGVFGQTFATGEFIRLANRAIVYYDDTAGEWMAGMAP